MIQLVAVPESERPISATIGPMIAGGISLLTQPEPIRRTNSAMTT